VLQRPVETTGEKRTSHFKRVKSVQDPLTDIARGLPSRQQIHSATVESHLHSLEIRILENSGHAVVIEDFYLQLNARRHDFRGARGMKIDRITRLFPRLDAIDP
jgi:hypothetical protein